MKELMMMVADIMPFETMVESMVQDCNEYKLVPTEDLKKKIVLGAHMICLKETMDQEGGFEALNKRLQTLKQADQLLNPNLS